MGILIGDKKWRGKGVANEVITQSAFWLKKKYNITTILLSVNTKNTVAIMAYKKINFKVYQQQNNNIKMSWYL